MKYTPELQSKIVQNMLAAASISMPVSHDPGEGDYGTLSIDKHVFIEPREFPAKVIGHKVKMVPGWYVFTYQYSNNYPHAPDDVWDVEITHTQDFESAAQQAILYIVKQMLRCRAPTEEEIADMNLEDVPQ